MKVTAVLVYHSLASLPLIASLAVEVDLFREIVPEI